MDFGMIGFRYLRRRGGAWVVEGHLERYRACDVGTIIYAINGINDAFCEYLERNTGPRSPTCGISDGEATADVYITLICLWLAPVTELSLDPRLLRELV